MKEFAQIMTAMAVAQMVGFLGVGALARGVDTIEALRCPGVTRIRVNTGTMLKDWVAWGACPRQGLTAPLKP